MAETAPTVNIKLLNNLNMPFLESAPASAATISEYIAELRKFEALFPGEETNLPLMVTRLRKIYYGLGSWDDVLIPDAESVTRPYETRELNSTRINLYGNDTLQIFVQRKIYSIKDGSTWHAVSGGSCSCGTRSIYHLQEVNAGGHWLDIGHVFAGLDALYHPSTVWKWFSAPAGVILDSNAEAVTWLGDLASVLGEWRFAQDEYLGSRPGSPRRTLSPQDCQAILTDLCPARDMLGNIDAFVLFDEYFEKTKQSKATPPRVSDLLESYYTTNNGYIERRFTSFAERMNLKWNQAEKKFDGEAVWHQHYEFELATCAAMYYGANTDSTYPNPKRQYEALCMSNEKSIARFLNAVMIKELRARVVDEQSSTT